MRSDMTITKLTGGSTCQTSLIKTNEHRFVRKKFTEAPADFFACEAQGLTAISQNNIFKTPTIISQQTDYLDLQYIKTQPPTKQMWYRVGEKLAQQHRVTAKQYGFEKNNYIGTVPQNNHWQTSWSQFYAEQRLLPLIEQHYFNTQDKKRFSLLLNKLDGYIDNSEPASFIHGDLWNTNILFGHDDIYLIDPAVYYASREIELAYLEFVGDDHVPLFEAYHANYPLSPDYQARKKLYLLYPYLFHLKMFGEIYLPGLRAILRYFS